MVTVPRLLTRRLLLTHSLVGFSNPLFRPLATANIPFRRGVRREAVMQREIQQQQLQQQANSILDEVYGPWTANWHPKPFERTAPRYLWTDAFGVCAYLSLYHATKEDRLLQQALALVEDVHNTLGHQRPTEPASGSSAAATGGTSRGGSTDWLQGADADHPTLAGLRIGKHQPEGHSDGDGQYFHYLTKWAFALNQVAAATEDVKYLRWAIELMQTAHRAFIYKTSSGPNRMCWKMSIDLSRPAVSSMGNLDPYDGLVTCTLLQQAAEGKTLTLAGPDGQGFDTLGLDQGSGGKVLQEEIADFQAMVDARYKSYSSDDPLDLGEALWLSHWQLGTPAQQQQQQQQGACAPGGAAWARHISSVSLSGLDDLWQGGYFDQPMSWRLGFREFGTSIGLQALLAVRPELRAADVWKQRVHQIHDTWANKLYTRDRDITPVMFATSLVPLVWIQQA